MKSKKLLLLLAVAALVLVGYYGLAFTAPGSTGQGIMVNLKGSGTFTIVDNKQYRFDDLAAAAYFTNTYDGVVEVSGSPSNRCPSGSAPAAPTPPVPDPLQVLNLSNEDINTAVKQNKCKFLDGGALDPFPYTQTLTNTTGLGSTKCTWTYTYHYTVAPTQTVAPLTAWELVRETNGIAEVDVYAEIAGESVVLWKALPKKKFSFSLRNSDGSSRVTDLALTVNGTVVASAIPSTVLENAPGAMPGDEGAVDFFYTTNAGSNGNTSLLANGDARTILNTDAFAGNNNGGSDGKALAWAIMDTQTLELGPGDYNVVLTGKVKGNNALADISFSVTRTVHIVAPGCGGQGN
jgi:hypothetical protein